MSDTPPVQPEPEPQPSSPQLKPAVENVGIADNTFVDTGAVKRAENAAAKKAMADTVAALGVKDLAEAKKILEQVRAAGEAQKSEAQRLHDDAVAKNAQADQVLAAAAADRLALKVERKLLAAGVPEAALARVAQTVNVAPDADDDTIAAEVETLKAELPGLFTPASAAPPPPAPGVTPPRPPGSKPVQSGMDLGREIGEAMAARQNTGDPFATFKPIGS